MNNITCIEEEKGVKYDPTLDEYVKKHPNPFPEKLVMAAAFIEKNGLPDRFKHPKKRKSAAQAIPSALIYEIIDGKPIYFAGYKDVLNGNKTIEEIMATGKKQSLMLNAIQTHLLRTHADKALTVMTGEIGIHISKNQNFSCDLVVFEDATLATLDINQNYFEVPPKLIVEVDLQADPTSININQYILKKIRKLLQFGVEKVIWVFSDPPLISVATAKGTWTINEWDTPIELIDGHFVNLADLFRQKNIKFEPVESGL